MNNNYSHDSFKRALEIVGQAVDARGALRAERDALLELVSNLPKEYAELRNRAVNAVALVGSGPLFYQPDNIKRMICNNRLRMMNGTSEG